MNPKTVKVDPSDEERLKNDEKEKFNFTVTETKLIQMDIEIKRCLKITGHVDVDKCRGKRGRPVPVLIPADVQPILTYLTTASIREEVGIMDDNKYLFPNTALGAIRSYDSVKTVCDEIDLKHTERITSVNLRKYTATLCQVVDLSNNELHWVCNHLGHTKRVHLEHYRQMSGFIERVQVSKLLMIQDLNMTKKFAGKKVDEIDFDELINDTGLGQPEPATTVLPCR